MTENASLEPRGQRTADLYGWRPRLLDRSAAEEKSFRVYGVEVDAFIQPYVEDGRLRTVVCYQRGTNNTKRARSKRRVLLVLEVKDLLAIAASLPWQTVRLGGEGEPLAWDAVAQQLRSPDVRNHLHDGQWLKRPKLRQRREETDRVKARAATAERNCNGHRRSEEARKLREPWRFTSEASDLRKERKREVALQPDVGDRRYTATLWSPPSKRRRPAPAVRRAPEPAKQPAPAPRPQKAAAAAAGECEGEFDLLW
jgi:hypothetical protein